MCEKLGAFGPNETWNAVGSGTVHFRNYLRRFWNDLFIYYHVTAE